MWNNRPKRCLLPEFALLSGEEHFALDVSKELRQRAESLAGRDVTVRGVLGDGEYPFNFLPVSSLEPQGDTSVREAESVKLTGKLHHAITHFATGKILFTADKMPEVLCRCWSARHAVTTDGTTYPLEEGDRPELHQRAEKLLGHEVEVRETLAGNEVTVEKLHAR